MNVKKCFEMCSIIASIDGTKCHHECQVLETFFSLISTVMEITKKVYEGGRRFFHKVPIYGDFM
jgi:hypothetical protein